jgi:error-prone DNA polymerase
MNMGMEKGGGPYVELHNHTNFSLLDGASHPEELVAKASAMGMASLAITDHDGLYAASVFHKAAKSASIKPIIGAELTLEGGFHITLLVENGSGYVNLSQLITQAQLSGAKSEPFLRFSDLEGHAEGLICLSGCGKGEIPSLLGRGEEEKAFSASQKYYALFGGTHFFIELQNHLNPEDMKLCAKLLATSKRLGVHAVATNNVHYGERGGREAPRCPRLY